MHTSVGVWQSSMSLSLHAFLCVIHSLSPTLFYCTSLNWCYSRIVNKYSRCNPWYQRAVRDVRARRTSVEEAQEMC